MPIRLGPSAVGSASGDVVVAPPGAQMGMSVASAVGHEIFAVGVGALDILTTVALIPTINTKMAMRMMARVSRFRVFMWALYLVEFFPRSFYV